VVVVVIITMETFLILLLSAILQYYGFVIRVRARYLTSTSCFKEKRIFT
jgi:hypothetical protein